MIKVGKLLRHALVPSLRSHFILCIFMEKGRSVMVDLTVMEIYYVTQNYALQNIRLMKVDS